MKKPVKATPKQIDALVEKRVTKKRYETASVPSGDLVKVVAAVKKFADKMGVSVHDVTFVNGWNGTYLQIKRDETPAEKRARIKGDEDGKYRQKKYDYDRWLREQERAQAVLATNTVSKCCKCKCCCC